MTRGLGAWGIMHGLFEKSGLYEGVALVFAGYELGCTGDLRGYRPGRHTVMWQATAWFGA